MSWTPVKSSDRNNVSEGNSESHYLLIGGSNCLIRGGFGDALRKKIGGVWHNRSIGNTSSLYGVEYILSNIDVIRKYRKIYFEFTLNDLIFEISNTLHPFMHRRWLDALSTVPCLREKLVVILLQGRGASQRYPKGSLFVVETYRAFCRSYGIRTADLLDMIVDVQKSNQPEIYVDNDHFNTEFAERLADEVCTLSDAPPPALSSQSAPEALIRTVSPTGEAQSMYSAESRQFKTSLISMPVLQLIPGAEVELLAPGGQLVGLWSVVTGGYGFLCFNHNAQEYFQVQQVTYPVHKPYLALRHFANPIKTKPGDRILIRCEGDVVGIRDAFIQNVHGQRISQYGNPVAIDIGPLVFFDSPE